MRGAVKGSVAALAAALLLAGMAAPAQAARIIECGNWGATESGRSGWTYEEIVGARIYNVTTRKVGCSKARRFVRRYRGTDTYFPTWRCREFNDYELSDIRCTASGGRVIHWQTGA
jgi:Ni/Co efflux regulator RcnB